MPINSSTNEHTAPSPLAIISGAIEQITLGEPVTVENLTMYPLVGNITGDPDYLTLDEALEGNLAEVTEISESGSVPELRFRNAALKPVLLVDGEELVGAKQNRVLNVTVMAPAKSEMVIPVSCVEAGRWNRHSRKFSTSGRLHHSRGRAMKMAQVSERMASGMGRHSNQSAVWEEIDAKSQRMQSRSETSARQCQSKLA